MQPSGVIVARVLTNDVTLMGYNVPAEVLTKSIYIYSHMLTIVNADQHCIPELSSRKE